MKIALTLLFSALITFRAYNQTIYQEREVEKTAVPQGGFHYLQQFIRDNLQLPFQARVQQVQGRVFVSGIVETDGSVSDLKIVKGIHPLCDAEALRVMNLYRAWQPALKDNNAVRQVFNFSIVFPDSPVTNYDSTSQSLIDYFTDRFQFTQDPMVYHFRRSIPVNKNGVIRDNVVIEELKKRQWKPFSSATFRKDPLMYKMNEEGIIDSLPAYRITARDESWNSYVPEMIFQKKNDLLLSTTDYQGFTVVGYSHYYKSGLLKERLMVDGKNQRIISWYDNGQIAEVIEKEPFVPAQPTKKRIVALWSRDGKQHVKEGNGWAVKGQSIVSRGLVQNGYKTGRWITKRADSTLFTDETYEAGILKTGTIYDKGEERTYTEIEKNPEFKGGLSGLAMFLTQNIKYPAQASRNNISGKVYLTFVVCEDGSLCDYEILKGIGWGCDEEALRVVKEMSGKWNPGLQYGKKVRVKYNMPVSFVLDRK